jgi:hypothetical protein
MLAITLYKSYVSTGFTQQIMSNFRILYYNGRLAIWTRWTELGESSHIA